MPSKKTAPPAEPTPGLWPVQPFTGVMSFIPNTRHMLTGHALSNEILQWDLDTGEIVHTWRKGRKNKEGVNDICVDDKRFIAVDQSGMAGSTSFVRVWELGKTKAPVLELLGHSGPVRIAAFLPHGRAVTGGCDDTVRVWDLEAGGQELSSMNHGDLISAIAVAPDGKTAISAAGSKAPQLKRWNLETGESLGDVATFASSCGAMALSSDGKLACVTGVGELHVLDFATGKSLVAVDQAHTATINSVAWSLDERFLVTASEHDETLRLFSAEGAPLQTVNLARPNLAAVGPDGVVYVALAYQGILRFKLGDGTLEQLV